MKDKLKKYLLPNLPYLFFVYLFDSLCALHFRTFTIPTTAPCADRMGLYL